MICQPPPKSRRFTSHNGLNLLAAAVRTLLRALSLSRFGKVSVPICERSRSTSPALEARVISVSISALRAMKCAPCGKAGQAGLYRRGFGLCT